MICILRITISTFLENVVNKPPLLCFTFASNKYLQLHLQECVFTGVGTAALADVLTVNNHIHTIDVRGCKVEGYAVTELDVYKKIPRERDIRVPRTHPTAGLMAGEEPLPILVRTTLLESMRHCYLLCDVPCPISRPG